MKSTDLMVGDWVSVIHNGKPCNVKITLLDPIQIGYDIKDEVIVKAGKAFKPIPLTPEILVANGYVYEKDYGSYYRSRWGEIDSDHYVTIGWNSKGEVYQYEVVTTMEDGFRSKKSAYGNTAIAVHELQHALRLCGLDDLADNFKLA